MSKYARHRSQKAHWKKPRGIVSGLFWLNLKWHDSNTYFNLEHCKHFTYMSSLFDGQWQVNENVWTNRAIVTRGARNEWHVLNILVSWFAFTMGIRPPAPRSGYFSQNTVNHEPTYTHCSGQRKRFGRPRSTYCQQDRYIIMFALRQKTFTQHTQGAAANGRQR